MPAHSVRLCLLSLCAFILTAPQEVRGHAQLLETVPAANDVLVDSPSEIKLIFNESVSVLSLQVRDGGGNFLDVGGDIGVEENDVVLPLTAELRDGQYFVAFRVLSADAHTISESFGFSVGAGQNGSFGAIPPVEPAYERWTPWGSGIARWLFMLALLCSAGFVVFRQLLSVPAIVDDWLAGAIRRAASWGLVALAAYWVAGAFVMVAGSAWSLEGLFAVASSTMGVSLATAALGFIALIFFPGRAHKRWALAGAALLIFSRVLTGHPASREPELVLQLLMATHVTAAAFWLAALIVLLRAMRCLSVDAVGVLAGDFGRIGVVAVGIVLTAAGIVMAYLHVAAPAALLTTQYGLLLSAKLGGVIALFAFAAHHKFRVTAALTDGDAAVGRRFQASLRLELLVLLTVIGVSTVVASTPPESTATAQTSVAPIAPLTVVSETGNYRLNVELSADASLIRLLVTDLNGQTVEPLEWTVTADLQSLMMEGIALPAAQEEHSAVTFENRVPSGTNARYTVGVLVTDFDLERFEFELPR